MNLDMKEFCPKIISLTFNRKGKALPVVALLVKSSPASILGKCSSLLEEELPQHTFPTAPAQSIKVQKRRGQPDPREGEMDSHSTELKFEDHSPGFTITVNRMSSRDGRKSYLLLLLDRWEPVYDDQGTSSMLTPSDNCKGSREFKLYMQKLAL